MQAVWCATGAALLQENHQAHRHPPFPVGRDEKHRSRANEQGGADEEDGGIDKEMGEGKLMNKWFYTDIISIVHSFLFFTVLRHA